jgi:hypothetical protein
LKISITIQSAFKINQVLKELKSNSTSVDAPTSVADSVAKKHSTNKHSTPHYKVAPGTSNNHCHNNDEIPLHNRKSIEIQEETNTRKCEKEKELKHSAVSGKARGSAITNGRNSAPTPLGKLKQELCNRLVKMNFYVKGCGLFMLFNFLLSWTIIFGLQYISPFFHGLFMISPILSCQLAALLLQISIRSTIASNKK